MELGKFDFEVSHEAIEPYCGAIMCACKGCELSEEESYLYIPLRVVDQRIKHRRIIRSYFEVEHVGKDAWVRNITDPIRKSIKHEGKEYIPIMLCENAARKLNLNLEIAKKDCKIWRETEFVPLRMTPDVTDEFSSYEDSLPKITFQRIEAIDKISCKTKFEEKHPNRHLLEKKVISYKETLTLVGVGVDEKSAIEDIDAKEKKLRFSILESEKVYPAATGVLKNLGSADEETLKKYLLDDEPNFLNKGKPTIQAFILLEDPDSKIISAEIDKIEFVKNASSYLGGLIKFRPRYDVYWTQKNHVLREYQKQHVIDYYFDLNQTTDGLSWDEQVKLSINLVDKLNMSTIENNFGSEALRIFMQMHSSLDGAEFLVKIANWGYVLKSSDWSSLTGITFESTAGIIMVRIRKDNDKIDDIVYADHTTKIAIRLVSLKGIITCNKM